jgi:epoxyqueuosine reductase QueG
MEFEDKARKIVEKECEDYFLGLVDLSQAKDVVIKPLRSLISEYPRAISIGITVPYKITHELLMNKGAAIYNETNCQLKRITAQLSGLLELEGHKALSLPKARMDGPTTFTSLHTLIANLANLGQIEKSGLLVTPEAGSGVNWGTVLTDAPIEEK